MPFLKLFQVQGNYKLIVSHLPTAGENLLPPVNVSGGLFIIPDILHSLFDVERVFDILRTLPVNEVNAHSSPGNKLNCSHILGMTCQQSCPSMTQLVPPVSNT